MESHSEPPQGATPTKRKREATETGAGNTEPNEAGKTTKTEQPKPTPRATEPHDPEPQPRKDEDTRTPRAQPTATDPQKPPKTGRKARQETEAEEPPTRDPEKATQGKEPTKEAKETMTKNLKMNANYQEHLATTKTRAERFVLPLLSGC